MNEYLDKINNIFLVKIPYKNDKIIYFNRTNGAIFMVNKDEEKNCISIKDYNIGKIILFPKASELLFHEIVHALENDYFNKKNPLFNKINNKVSTELLTMSNDPYMIYGKNIRHVDDEGKFLTKNILIEKGLLKKIIGCRYAKEKKQIKNSSQSSRRESHRFISTGRSYCIVVNPVKRNKLKSILNFNDVLVIHDFKKGCFNFEDGKIYCTSNDFSVVKNGIFNGIKGTIKIENKVDVILSSIIDIFDDLEYFENMCYSSSGHISNSTYTLSILLKNSNLNCKLTIF